MGDHAHALIEHGVLSREAAARAARAAHGGDVASAALELGLADEAAIARTLARLHECPGVELGRSVIPASNLDAVPADLCRARRLIPLSVGRSEVVVAMADPDDLHAADEVRFVTGRKVLAYAAVGGAVVRALEGVERARREGAPAWRGPRAPALPDPAAAHAAVVLPSDHGVVELPEVTSTMEIVGIAEPVGGFQPPPRRARAAPVPREARETVRIEGVAVGKVAVVADDDAEVRALVAKLLESLGCLVFQAADGRAALAQVRETGADVVILDAMMPGMHGFEVCRSIKADRELRSTRVVLCSAVYRGTVGTDAQTAFGANAFVEKPFRLEELTRVLKVALVGPAAAETSQERAAREEAAALWRAAAEALALDRIAEALEHARAAATKDPWSAEAHYYLGQALARQGHLLEAVAAYERAAELRPDVDAVHQCLAQTYESLGFQKSARDAWTRAAASCADPVRKQAFQARVLQLLGV